MSQRAGEASRPLDNAKAKDEIKAISAQVFRIPNSGFRIGLSQKISTHHQK